MNTFELRRFRLWGNWTPLFERLAGWRLHQDGVWTDGESVVVLAAGHDLTPELGFVVRDIAEWEQLFDASSIRSHSFERHEINLTTPSGVGVEFRLALDPLGDRDRQRIIMNHVALNATHFQEEKRWFAQLLGNYAVLARDSAWEPVSGRHVRDVHFFKPESFYITLREAGGRSGVDHVGWMTDEPCRVDEIAVLVRQIGWEIIFGPAEIDGSYLFHFRGPDDRVHDFFWPRPSLVASRERHDELRSC